MNLSNQYMHNLCKDLAARTTNVPVEISAAILKNPENFRHFAQYLTGIKNSVLKVIEKKLQLSNQFESDAVDKYKLTEQEKHSRSNDYNGVNVSEKERLLQADDKNDRLEEAKSSLINGMWHRINYIDYVANKKDLCLKDVTFVQRLSRAAKEEISPITKHLPLDSDEKKVMDNARLAFKAIQHNYPKSSLAELNTAS